MVRLQRATRKKLGQILIEAGILSSDQVDSVIKEQKNTGELFGDILLMRELVTENDIALAIVTQYRLPFIPLSMIEIEPEMAGIFPEGLLRRYQFVPFDKIGNLILIASAGTVDVEVIDELEQMSGLDVRIYITTVSDVRKAITDHFIDETDFNEMGNFLGLGES